MTFITIFLLSFGAALKATLQSRFGKKNVKTSDDVIAFNGLIFLFSAIVALLFGDLQGTSFGTIIAGLFFGVSSVIFQLTYLKAMSEGPVSMTVLFSNFGMVIPMLVSIIFYDERITGSKAVGFVLVCLSILLNAVLKEKQKASSKWIVYALLTFAASGALLTVQKVFTNTASGHQTVEFISVAYLTATVLSLFFFLFRKKFMSGKRTFDFKVSTFVAAFVIGSILSAVQIFLTFAIEKLGALLILPGYNGGTTVLMFLIGAFAYKEKHDRMRWLAACIGVIAIIILSI